MLAFGLSQTKSSLPWAEHRSVPRTADPKVTFCLSSSRSAENRVDAVRKLSLKLVEQKRPVPAPMIDHVAQQRTEN